MMVAIKLRLTSKCAKQENCGGLSDTAPAVISYQLFLALSQIE